MTKMTKSQEAKQLSREAGQLVDELMLMAAQGKAYTKRQAKWVELCEVTALFCYVAGDDQMARDFEAVAQLVARLNNPLDAAFTWKRFWGRWNNLYEDKSTVFSSPLLA